MLIRLLAAAALCLTLSGCILQSRELIFAETDGKLMLASYGARFASYTRTGDNWFKDEEALSFAVEGQHYIASDEKIEIKVLFANISDNWYAVQTVEGGETPKYALAEARDGEILVHPLDCKSLQERGGFERFAEFKDDNCVVREGVDTASMFAALAANPAVSDLKLVPLP